MSQSGATLSPADDPDVLGLVPPDRRGRTVVVAALVVVALVLAWTSGAARPRLTHPSHSEGAARDLGGGRALVGLRIERHGALPLTLDSVTDTDDGRVAAAWIVRTEPGDFADGGFFGEAGARVDAATPPPRSRPLPAQPEDGEYLVVLYTAIDCDASSPSTPRAVEHTLLGIELHERLTGLDPQVVCH